VVRTSFHRSRGPSHGSAARPLSVLLAEDQGELRELLARGLESDGACVECVSDGAAALELLFDDRFRPDVVVSDVRMPGFTGVEVLRAMRTAGLTTPVVLFTGFGHAVSPEELGELGGAALLEKPFDFDDLRTALLHLGFFAGPERTDP